MTQCLNVGCFCSGGCIKYCSSAQGDKSLAKILNEDSKSYGDSAVDTNTNSGTNPDESVDTNTNCGTNP